MKVWFPLVLNIVVLIASVIVHLTPTQTDDQILDKIKTLLPVVLADSGMSPDQYTEENFNS